MIIECVNGNENKDLYDTFEGDWMLNHLVKNILIETKFFHHQLEG